MMTAMADADAPNPPGWYPDESGQQRYWDGTQWAASPPPPPPPPSGATPPPPPPPPPGAGTPPPAGAVGATTTAPPSPPWGTWTWPDGTPIDRATLPAYDPSKKLTVGLLGIFLGGFGIHKFLLGYSTEGAIQIGITVVTCGFGAIIGLIEGIIYLTKSDSEFYWTYVAGRKTWF
jgi:TM2 domain-containing membrane protein YozV